MYVCNVRNVCVKCMYICMYIRMFVCMHVRTYVCMYVCMNVCVYVYMSVYICMYYGGSCTQRSSVTYAKEPIWQGNLSCFSSLDFLRLNFGSA